MAHLDSPAGGDACLGRTCMKWSADGELADLDFQLVLERLGAVDAALGHVLADGVMSQNDPSLNSTA